MVKQDIPDRAFFLRAWTSQLYEEYRQLCYTYRLKLQRPLIRIEDLGQRWGVWNPTARTISLSQKLISDFPWEYVLEILKHEMAHQIVDELYQVDDAHGEEFKRACAALGMAEWSSRATAAEMPIPRPGEFAQTGEQERLLSRIEKLLRLAQSENEHEALLAMRRVQEIYAKYNLENRILDRPRDWTYRIIKLKKKRIERYQSKIASILNEHFFVEVVHSHLYDAEDRCEYRTLEFLGTRENVTMAEYVYHFLNNQLGYLWRGFNSAKKHRLATKNSFYLGVLGGFKEKLESGEKEYDRKEKNEGRPSLFLVVKKDPEAEKFLNHRYPRLAKLGRGLRQHDSQAYQAGHSQGRALTLKKALDPKAQPSGKYLKP